MNRQKLKTRSVHFGAFRCFRSLFDNSKMKICFLLVIAGLLSVLSKNSDANDYPATFRPEEIQWLHTMKNTPIRYVIPPKYAPISFICNEGANGIVKDYIHILKSRLSLNFQLVDISFKKGLELAKQGEVDFFPCLGQRSDRETFLNFIKTPYLQFQLTIITLRSEKSILGIQDLDGKRVAVDKKSGGIQQIKK